MKTLNHLSTCHELCGTMGVSEDEEAAYPKLFPFSLIGKTKN